MSWINTLNHLIWRSLFVCLLLISGYLTWKLKGLQFKIVPYAFKKAFHLQKKEDQAGISHFEALTTSLAATIGIGTIAGVSSAIALGGLGSLLWMFLISIITMVIKYAEAILAIFYRIISKEEIRGGPMYYLERGLKRKNLGIIFALCTIAATLTTGNMIQSHCIADACLYRFPHLNLPYGIILAFLMAAVLIGGVKSIVKVNACLVPCMGVLYMGSTLWILITHLPQLPLLFKHIIITAFTGDAAIGAFVGSTLIMALEIGVARGIFSNEAGLGSSSIAAAQAQSEQLCDPAAVSMIGGVLSTCMGLATGLVIGVMQVVGTQDSQGELLQGVGLTMLAFKKAFIYGDVIILLSSLLFGFSTMLGWAYYGEQCMIYLGAKRYIVVYRAIFCILTAMGTQLLLSHMWTYADISNACMACMNLVGVIGLSSVVVSASKPLQQQLDLLEPTIN